MPLLSYFLWAPHHVRRWSSRLERLRVAMLIVYKHDGIFNGWLQGTEPKFLSAEKR